MGAQRGLHPAEGGREAKLGQRFPEEAAWVLILEHQVRNRQARKGGDRAEETTGEGWEL